MAGDNIAGATLGERASRWHSHDWARVLEGKATADRFFQRAGLIRKDRLANFAPPEHHPETAVVRCFEELQVALKSLKSVDSAEGSAGGDSSAVRFVLKKAHSSNADGIRFLTGSEAEAVANAEAHGSGRSGLSCFAESGIGSATALLLAVTALVGGMAAVSIGVQPSTSSRVQVKRLAAACAAPAIAMMTAAALATHLVAGAGHFSGRQQQLPRLAALATEFKQLLEPVVPSGSAASHNTKASPEVWILQRHIEPWLHEGRKFHMRVLFLCIGDLKAYVHEDVRLLIATEPFAEGNTDSLRHAALVTNMGVNSAQAGYAETEQNLPLTARGSEVMEATLSEVARILGETLDRVRSAGRRQFFTTPNCWELFGVDFLVEDVSGRVVLLEINPSPSLSMYGGQGVREALLGPDPLTAPIPAGWLVVPLASET